MSNNYAVLPCNGIDKCAGCISKEVALLLNEKIDVKILCPVFYRVSDVKYDKILSENNLLVIDGCNTKCSSKLANEKKLEVKKKINISEEAKKLNISIHNNLKLGADEVKLCNSIVESFIKDIKQESNLKVNKSDEKFEKSFKYDTYKKDKFTFRIAFDENLYFNENDCWIYIEGNKATIGVTDYVQHSLGDIMFFEPPKLGEEVEQFAELGYIESTKAVFEIVSPGTGKIVAVNHELEDYPEYINENPYEKGWLVKLELTDIEEDKELLINDKDYFEILKRKVDNFHV